MSRRFIELEGGEVVPDAIRDDQAMAIETSRGLLVVLGCAHAGIVNTLNHIIRKCGTDRIFAIVGGTHIGFSGDRQLEESISALKSYPIQCLVPSHCTGQAAAAHIKEHFEASFQFSHVGWSMAF